VNEVEVVLMIRIHHHPRLWIRLEGDDRFHLATQICFKGRQ
jgi:hypothetical protein